MTEGDTLKNGLDNMKHTNLPVRIGERYDRDAGMELLQKMPLGEIMRMAHAARKVRMPGNYVSFVYDTNPNYTNVCVSDCSFCSFYRRPQDKEAYTLSPEELAARVVKAYKMGATTVLLQGGHNPRVRLKDWLEYIRVVKVACPDIHIHPFSPAEYVFMAHVEKIPVREVLETVFAEGIDTVPGGGAEILADRVRAKIAKNKATSDQWLDVCATAHDIGFRTTATMMFGHVETNEDIVEHLLRLRDLQDRTGGFTSFIPWSFKPGNSVLGKKLTSTAHPAKYVRIIALARLLLDNFQHIQSSWFSESIPAGQLGLLAGADDFGGVLVEENVLMEAGHDRVATVEDVKTIIRRTGFIPIQRDSRYNLKPVRRFPD
jgi:cyclic dehypoxanthinyl futalosine synthase